MFVSLFQRMGITRDLDVPSESKRILFGSQFGKFARKSRNEIARTLNLLSPVAEPAQTSEQTRTRRVRGLSGKRRAPLPRIASSHQYRRTRSATPRAAVHHAHRRRVGHYTYRPHRYRARWTALGSFALLELLRHSHEKDRVQRITRMYRCMIFMRYAFDEKRTKRNVATRLHPEIKTKFLRTQHSSLNPTRAQTVRTVEDLTDSTTMKMMMMLMMNMMHVVVTATLSKHGLNS